jgi:hypothetical protein
MGSSQNVSSSNIGSLVDCFFQRCLLEESDSSSRSWGEDSGLPVNSLQNLARASDEAFSSLQEEDEEEEDDDEDTHEQEAVNHYATCLLMSVEDDQETYEMVLQRLLLATSQDATIETLQQLASELGIQVCSGDEIDRVDYLEMVLGCSSKETLQETTEDSCPICLEGFLKSQEVLKLPCSHGMHVECCKRFFKTSGVKPLCPICRFDMSSVTSNQIQQKEATN